MRQQLEAEKVRISKRFSKAGMREENADTFADAIMKEDDDEDIEAALVQQVISAALDEEMEISDSERDESEQEDDFEGIEETYGLNSSYFDIFDNLLRKYVTDLNQKDEEVAQQIRQLGAKSMFAE